MCKKCAEQDVCQKSSHIEMGTVVSLEMKPHKDLLQREENVSKQIVCLNAGNFQIFSIHLWNRNITELS